VSTEGTSDLGWLLLTVLWTVARGTCLLGSARERAHSRPTVPACGKALDER
jgi:hypothetical protein